MVVRHFPREAFEMIGISQFSDFLIPCNSAASRQTAMDGERICY
jgi:hypothetical protein